MKGVQGVLEGNLLGATISELQRKYKMGVLEATTGLKEYLEFLHCLISSGDHSSVELPAYRVSKGEVLFIDNGVSVSGYNSDMGRTFVIGKSNDLQRRIYAALRTGYEECLSRIKPGVKMKELYRVMHDTIHKSGLEWFRRGNVGHMLGIGSLIEWPPRVSVDEETILFQGTASEAIRGFPQNVNVAVALSFAGIGLEKTQVKILCSPYFTTNSHEVQVVGEFGRLTTRTDNVPTPQNPKTSYLAVLSAIATLKGILDCSRVGT